jgi:hypothetical protein
MKLEKKRKTLHAVRPDQWIDEFGGVDLFRFRGRKSLVVFSRWYASFQKYGSITFCGMRVKTYGKLADSGEDVSCPTCREAYALSLLAELD